MKSLSNDNEPAGKMAEMPKTPKTLRRKCPICKAPAARDHAPFCSSRCTNIDLSRWLQGHYVIAGSDSAPSEEEEPG